VILTVANSTGSDNDSTMLIVAPASTLTANFTYSPSSPAAGQDIQFTDASTGNPTAWQWSFGDGTTAIVQNPTHVYASGGAFETTLTITAGSNTRTASKTILVRSANVIVAASPSFTDVSAAISAAQSGDTVMIPAGTATWSAPMPSIKKSLSVIGAGIGQTVIISNYTQPYDTTNPLRGLWSFYPSNATAATNPPFRLSGMTIDCAHKSDGVWIRNDSTYPCTKIRLDHLRIINATFLPGKFGISIGRSGAVYGVCDNCYINSDLISNTGDDEVWKTTAYNFGDEYNFYFEDNEWTATPSSDTLCSDGNHSPRYCFRHNTIDARGLAREYLSPMFDLHGNQASPMRAGQGAEIYENTILVGPKAVLMMDQRGGKVLCYNNTVVRTTGILSLRVREEHHDSLNPTGTTEWGVAGKNLITGQPQHISDSYYWNNTLNGTLVPVRTSAETVNYGSPLGIVPQENREFWNQNPSFNGTAGIGVGPLASRPTTCTVGAAYWATDVKTLFRCTAANVWTEYYKPYTYPHPLRTSLNAGADGN
jgi:hypothetical protein